MPEDTPTGPVPEPHDPDQDDTPHSPQPEEATAEPDTSAETGPGDAGAEPASTDPTREAPPTDVEVTYEHTPHGHRVTRRTVHRREVVEDTEETITDTYPVPYQPPTPADHPAPVG